MKVLVLRGGDSPERDISMKSAASIIDALKSLGVDYIVYDPIDGDEGLEAACKDADVVLPIVHGLNVEDGVLQRKLEKLGVKFLGSDSESSENCFDKQKTHRILESAGIRMPAYAIVGIDDLDHELFNKPFVLKPYNTGSSVDTLIAREVNQENLEEAKSLLERYDTMLLEELIDGMEITVPILRGRALPVILIIPPEGEEFDLDNKYNGRSQEICPIPEDTISKSVQVKAQDLAERVNSILECRHISRVDIMLDKDGQMFVLETNTIPGLTDQSLYPNSAKVAGYDFPKLVQEFIKMVSEE